MATDVRELLGGEADTLLKHESKTIDKDRLILPGPDFVDRVLIESDRPIAVLRNLQSMFNHGRLGGTGYLSILPVDQGIEHSAAASFSKNPGLLRPARDLSSSRSTADCSAVATTLGGLGIVARRYAHKIPLIVKLNHNELPALSRPATTRSFRLGATGRRPRGHRASVRPSTSALRRAPARSAR